MPFYDYYCEANKRTVEVFHLSKVKLKTWGQVCELAKIKPGKTSIKAKVIRVISNVTTAVFRTKGLDKDEPSDKLIV